jgi:hypothetical protein
MDDMIAREDKKMPGFGKPGKPEETTLVAENSSLTGT